jgi:hypothetical protein
VWFGQIPANISEEYSASMFKEDGPSSGKMKAAESSKI